MKKIITIITFCILYFTAATQKLPNIQQTSLRAPANVNIDGKATEWGNQFQAHNSNTSIWYTIANDDDKLYFIIQAREQDVIHKVMRGCITITINTAAKKNSKNAMTVTFPSYAVKDAPMYP